MKVENWSSTSQVAIMELKPVWHQFLCGTLQDVWTDTQTQDQRKAYIKITQLIQKKVKCRLPLTLDPQEALSAVAS